MTRQAELIILFIESFLKTKSYLLVYLEGHAKCFYDVMVLLQVYVHTTSWRMDTQDDREEEL